MVGAAATDLHDLAVGVEAHQLPVASHPLVPDPAGGHGIDRLQEADVVIEVNCAAAPMSWIEAGPPADVVASRNLLLADPYTQVAVDRSLSGPAARSRTQPVSTASLKHQACVAGVLCGPEEGDCGYGQRLLSLKVLRAGTRLDRLGRSPMRAAKAEIFLSLAVFGGVLAVTISICLGDEPAPPGTRLHFDRGHRDHVLSDEDANWWGGFGTMNEAGLSYHAWAMTVFQGKLALMCQ